MAGSARSFNVIIALSCIYVYHGSVFAGSVDIAMLPVSIESVPFVAYLRGSGRCAGGVLHERFVLTAASCLVDDFGRLRNVTQVLVGTNDLSKGGELYDIDTVIPHRKYSIHTGDYNVGLVKLTHEIAFGPKVGPIMLGRNVGVGDLVNVVGWGLEMRSSDVLHEVTVPVLRKKECQRGLLGRIIGPRMLCAGVAGERRGDCVGDEGGPVLANRTLVAVVTPFAGCGELPGLYTRVGAVRHWIITTILDNSSS